MMSTKTRKVLLHTIVALLCAALAIGSYLLGTKLNAGSADPSKGIGGIFYILSVFILIGVFCHVKLALQHRKIYCKNCGSLGTLQDYEVLKKNMASDGKHIASEKLRLNVRCNSCGQLYDVVKKFSVSTYNSKHHVWKIVDINKATREYIEGKAWF